MYTYLIFFSRKKERERESARLYICICVCLKELISNRRYILSTFKIFYDKKLLVKSFTILYAPTLIQTLVVYSFEYRS